MTYMFIVISRKGVIIIINLTDDLMNYYSVIISMLQHLQNA